MMEGRYNILILGASYGSLLASKLLLAGHDVTVICRERNAETINRKGIRIRLPIDGKREPLEIVSHELIGRLTACGPTEANPLDYDLVCLAMQEPQYHSSGVRQLVDAIAQARIPCVSIMNMPPLPYLKRIPSLHTEPLEHCYTDPTVWRHFDPDLMTLCSPDPQTFRLSEEGQFILQVTLPTNFKAARFEHPEHTAILKRLHAHIAVSRYHDVLELPVKLKVFDSIFVPLAKWPMLITGNYRCVGDEEATSIQETVHADLDASRTVYEWVCRLCMDLGAARSDLVPFEKYAEAATHLRNPSSAARALFSGATDIERVDLLVQEIATQREMHLPVLDEIVDRVNARLTFNRRQPARELASA